LTDSCTSVLEIVALLLRDRGADQEIILPLYTFSSTAAAFARAGFKIIFAEINPLTMMIDIADAKSKVTSNTVGIVIVQYGGFGADTKSFKNKGSICHSPARLPPSKELRYIGSHIDHVDVLICSYL
jgi:dTDP-4-amino-4,6-dideoxygalactose transaminase